MCFSKKQLYETKLVDAASQSIISVKPFVSENSFLCHKITCRADHHTGNFESKLPMAGRVLTKGQVELIRRWINAGAPRSGRPVDASVLDDKSACQPEVTPLEAPAAGEGLMSEVTFFDNNSKAVRLGLTSEDEMNIIFGYYY